MSDELSGKVALVTGASKNIGKGIALEVGASGAVTYLTARSVEDVPGQLASLQRTAAEIEARGGTADRRRLRPHRRRAGRGRVRPHPRRAGPTRPRGQRRFPRLLRDGRRVVLGPPVPPHHRVPRHRPAVGLRDHGAGGADDDPAAFRRDRQRLVARRRELPAVGPLRGRQGRDRQGHPGHRVRAEAARRRGGVALARPGAHRRPARQHGRHRRRAAASSTGSTSASGRRPSSTAWPWSRWRRTPTSSSAPAARTGRRRWHGSTASPRTTGTSPRRWPTAS